MDALKTYSVPMICALIALALVQLLKSDKIPIDIPPRYRPWLAIGLALVGTVATRIIQGGDFGTAMLEGLGSGLTSVGIFGAASSTNPKDPPDDPPSGTAAPAGTVVLPPDDPFAKTLVPRIAFACFAALALAGCGAMQKVEHVVQLSSEVIARAEPCLMLQYEQAQVKCLELESTDAARACVDSVRVTWKPIIEALGELRDVRCGLEPEKCHE